LRSALDRLTKTLPPPDTTAPVRLWIDRVFTIKGAGTVVTGTLGAGRVRVGDELSLGGETVRVRGLQTLGEQTGEVAAVARIAVNLRGAGKDRIGRGNALLTPGRFRPADLVDVRVHGDAVDDLPATLTLHVGSAAVPVRVRPLGADTCRLRLASPLPLRIGDRALLRDPGRHHVAGGVTVLDVMPPGRQRRKARAAELETMDGRPDIHGELRRRLLMSGADLAAMGVPITGKPTAGDWYADPAHWSRLRERLTEEIAAYQAEHPLEPGAPIEAVRHRLGLPDRALVEALVEPPLRMRQGRIGKDGPDVPTGLVNQIDQAFAGKGPFAAPEAYELAASGLGPRQLAAAVRAGLLIQLAPNVVLREGAPGEAAEVLRKIGQPFTLSEARQALGTTRRVAVPLLELLDRRKTTERDAENRRMIY
jgi:selenocysteine-specific elongation factor